jgi:hypothetical protein
VVVLLVGGAEERSAQRVTDFFKAPIATGDPAGDVLSFEVWAV